MRCETAGNFHFVPSDLREGLADKCRLNFCIAWSKVYFYVQCLEDKLQLFGKYAGAAPFD